VNLSPLVFPQSTIVFLKFVSEFLYAFRSNGDPVIINFLIGTLHDGFAIANIGSNPANMTDRSLVVTAFAK